MKRCLKEVGTGIGYVCCYVCSIVIGYAAGEPGISSSTIERSRSTFTDGLNASFYFLSRMVCRFFLVSKFWSGCADID